MPEPIVSVNCIRHIYPDRTEVSLCGMEFTVGRGEIVAALGANGAGKTTLLQHITGMLRPVEGTVEIFGLNPYRDFEKIRLRLGVVFQNPGEQIIGPTVEEDVAFGLGPFKLARQEREERVHWALKRLGIEHLRGKVPHYLSGGEIKKVALAGALATKPELLVLDEPFAELDVRAVGDLVELLRGICREEGTAIVFTSHQLEPVALLADTVYVLNQGRVVSKGKPLEIFQQSAALASSNLRPPDLFRLVALLKESGIRIEPALGVETIAAQIVAVLKDKGLQEA